MDDKTNTAWILHQLGMLDADAGDVAGARARYEESLRLWRQIGDVRGEAATLHQLGMLAAEAGDGAAARARYAHSLALERAIGDRLNGATTLDWLGGMAGEGRGRPPDRLAQMRYWTAAYLLLEPMGHPYAQTLLRDCEALPEYAALRAAGAFAGVLAELW